MNIADLARHNAIPLEVKKDGLQQRQNGDWVLRLVVQAADMDQRITDAAMGTRFQAALVEIGDDELPKQKGKLDWRQLQPAAQVAIRCGEPRFREYLAIAHDVLPETNDDADYCIKNLCGIKSKTELATNHKARAL